LQSPNELTRRDMLRITSAGAAGFVLAGKTGFASAAGDKPNVVLVIIDSTRTDHMGSYGGPHRITPNLDAFARESLRFTDAHPESMPTVPARRAIFTGLRSFPFRHWHPYKFLSPTPGFQPIPRKRTTVAEYFNRAGYLTAYVTDNPHTLEPPYDSFRRRFDVRGEIQGQLPVRHHPRNPVGNGYVKRWTPPEMRDEPVDGRLREFLTLRKRDRHTDDDWMSARTFKSGIDFLENSQGKGPFALIVDSFDPHEPWDPPYDFLKRFANVKPGPQPVQPFHTPSGLTEDMRASTLRRARALYSGELAFVDHWFGHLMNKIDELGLTGNTWVIMLSDHGVMLGERGIIGKSHSNLQRELSHVPFMIRHPEGKRAGKTSDYLASTHDVTPTMLGAAGLSVPPKLQGEDLSKIFRGKQPKRRTYWTSALNDYVVASDGDWLLICHNQGGKDATGRGPKLYDLRRDPRQVHDVSHRHRGQVHRLYGLVRRDAGGRLPDLG
jgi:arylsulfatase A-like enzyme